MKVLVGLPVDHSPLGQLGDLLGQACYFQLVLPDLRLVVAALSLDLARLCQQVVSLALFCKHSCRRLRVLLRRDGGLGLDLCVLLVEPLAPRFQVLLQSVDLRQLLVQPMLLPLPLQFLLPHV